MDKSKIRKLLRLYDKDVLNNNEEKDLNDWYHQLKGGRPQFDELLKEHGGEDGLKTHLYQQFNQKLQQQPKRLKPIYNKNWYKIAAVLIIGISAITILLFKSKRQDNIQNKIAATPVKNNIPTPGSGKVMLILANGNSVQLDGMPDSSMAQAGVNIKKVGTGKLVYNDSINGQSTEAVAYNTLVIPRAGEYQLVLQDGTKVWLNSESRLRYPVRFTGKERRVELEGEAYFEVKHNSAMPFKVSTGEVTTTDLGTQFNIKAYGDDNKIAATLLEGSINVNDSITGQTKLLVPGKQAKIAKGNGEITVSDAKTNEVIAWKNGYFIFDNEDIRSVLKLISRWYDVDVTYNLTKKIKIGGTFSRAENLPNLLKIIESIGNIHCELKERRIMVTN